VINEREMKVLIVFVAFGLFACAKGEKDYTCTEDLACASTPYCTRGTKDKVADLCIRNFNSVAFFYDETRRVGCCCNDSEAKEGVGELCTFNEESFVCDSYGVSVNDVTVEICDNGPGACEAYIKKGIVNGVDVESCTDYCGAYGLACKEMWDDTKNRCIRRTQYDSCDWTTDPLGGKTSDHICVCVAPTTP